MWFCWIMNKKLSETSTIKYRIKWFFACWSKNRYVPAFKAWVEELVSWVYIQIFKNVFCHMHTLLCKLLFCVKYVVSNENVTLSFKFFKEKAAFSYTHSSTITLALHPWISLLILITVTFQKFYIFFTGGGPSSAFWGLTHKRFQVLQFTSKSFVFCPQLYQKLAIEQNNFHLYVYQ